MSAARFLRNDRVAWQVIDGEAVLVNLATGETLGLNETGGWIWSQINESSTADMTRAMVSRFQITAEVAQHDVDEFVAMLAEKGLVSRRSAD